MLLLSLSSLKRWIRMMLMSPFLWWGDMEAQGDVDLPTRVNNANSHFGSKTSENKCCVLVITFLVHTMYK